MSTQGHRSSVLVAILEVQRCSLTNTTLICCRKVVAILDDCSSSPSKCGKHIIYITDGCRLELMSDQELGGRMLQPASTHYLFPCLRIWLFVPFIVWAQSPRKSPTHNYSRSHRRHNNRQCKRRRPGFRSYVSPACACEPIHKCQSIELSQMWATGIVYTLLPVFGVAEYSYYRVGAR